MARNPAMIWDGLANRENLAALVRTASSPHPYQRELKGLIDDLYVEPSTIIEAGSYTGVTSFLLDDRFAKTVFDANPAALELSERLFRYHGKSATFVTGDMFRMPFPDRSFDIVFNCCVFEHFLFADRVAALREYGRILKPSGNIIIAYPNYFSLPYRIGSYLSGKQRPTSQERGLITLRSEIKDAGLRFRESRLLDYITPLQMVRRVEILGRPLKYLFKWIGFQGYLRVVIVRKP
ncbi:class I SAM-dependent methyltransferase [Geomesophilobacter sediminis]|uniref:Class I SAM-dependent methyltransferase n=1 Tax=Geomesophilobacter sediminis TaxID=2798584 RepID=A0A8J7LY40_9BACT|nr:class I SAM-dependent methyltransferase [Geomesophilobacter sediminis]MBJ6724276.1 class I SAM-dependent methyltransferase [Geomesophilobacter sediminis]